MSLLQDKPLRPALTPAAAMPWPVMSPFRMRPGLSRLAPADAVAAAPGAPPLAPRAAMPTAVSAAERAGAYPAPPDAPPLALFLRDALAADYAAAKQQSLRRRPPVGQADPAVLQAVAGAYQAQTGVALPPLAEALATGMQEDFVVLHDESDADASRHPGAEIRHGDRNHHSDGGNHSNYSNYSNYSNHSDRSDQSDPSRQSGHTDHPGGRHHGQRGASDESDHLVAPDRTLRARYLSVCFPSNWAPSEKLGLDFTAIHAPVADNALLQAGARGITHMAFRQSSMLRHVWLLSPGADLAQHPESRRMRWEDAVAQADADRGRLIDRVFFRVERQTTLPLPALRRGVFFIRVLVCPLGAVLAEEAGRAAALADALASMSPAVAAYRGLGAVRERVCRELLT